MLDSGLLILWENFSCCCYFHFLYDSYSLCGCLCFLLQEGQILLYRIWTEELLPWTEFRKGFCCVCGLQGSILCRRYEEDIDHSLWGACLLILIDQMLEFIRLVFGTLGLDR